MSVIVNRMPWLFLVIADGVPFGADAEPVEGAVGVVEIGANLVHFEDFLVGGSLAFCGKHVFGNHLPGGFGQFPGVSSCWELLF